ncbi:MAG: hypothetical protein HY649_10745 [Acidobacteria bacterium]|nr:hypothetical protein [Acidobacteriota bacterium]
MKQEINPKLLRDLASLARRYRPEEFAGLVSALEEGSLLSQLSDVIRHMEECSRRTHHQRGSEKRRLLPVSNQTPSKPLDYLSGLEPEKLNLLNEFSQLFDTRELLPTTGQARAFAQELGLGDLPAKANRKTISAKFVKFLSSRPLEEIKGAVEQARAKSTTGGATLKDWADIIMRSKAG